MPALPIRRAAVRWTCLLALAVAPAGIIRAQQAPGRSDPPASAHEQFLPAIDADAPRMISFFPIGGSSPNVKQRRVGFGVAELGWRGFIGRYVQPQIDWGVRRIQLHNPFGTLPNEPMQFDQYLHAREAKLRFLTEGFVEAWKPITSGQSGPKIEVIAYLGKLEQDPDFEKLREEGRPGEWLARAVVSVGPVLEAGMSVGLDSAAISSPDSMTARFAEVLRGLGVRVYIEPRPHVDYTNWHSYHVFATDTIWKRTDPAVYGKKAGPKARNEQLTGEIVRLVRNWGDEPRPLEWYMEQYREILADGHTPAVRLYKHPLREISPEDFKVRGTGIGEQGSGTAESKRSLPPIADRRFLIADRHSP